MHAIQAWFKDSAESETTWSSHHHLIPSRYDIRTIRFRNIWLAETSSWRVETAESCRITPSYPEPTRIFIIFINFLIIFVYHIFYNFRILSISKICVSSKPQSICRDHCQNRCRTVRTATVTLNHDFIGCPRRDFFFFWLKSKAWSLSWPRNGEARITRT